MHGATTDVSGGAALCFARRRRAKHSRGETRRAKSQVGLRDGTSRKAAIAFATMTVPTVLPALLFRCVDDDGGRTK